MLSHDLGNELRILESWRANVEPWVGAVRERQIESRRLVTDQAIIDAVLTRSPDSVLDLGCGEGWLARALVAADVRVTGIDAVAGLVARAQELGGGEFHCLSFDEIAACRLQGPADVAVCNFSLLGRSSVARLLAALPALLNSGGAIAIQTLHPLMACGELPYQDGWRAGSWSGFSAEFCKPAPWYFRTLASWIALLESSNLRLATMLEPLDPVARRPASVILVAEPR